MLISLLISLYLLTCLTYLLGVCMRSLMLVSLLLLLYSLTYLTYLLGVCVCVTAEADLTLYLTLPSYLPCLFFRCVHVIAHVDLTLFFCCLAAADRGGTGIQQCLVELQRSLWPSLPLPAVCRVTAHQSVRATACVFWYRRLDSSRMPSGVFSSTRWASSQALAGPGGRCPCGLPAGGHL